ncbi:MAG: FAD-dependent oxidoreductase [Ilumatobacter sp.]|uniref:FAD-dependent oxidoreductase n=1 Tax=Ilumatobacter sp. TaxID=1967498 RepID=UPI00391C7933
MSVEPRIDRRTLLLAGAGVMATVAAGCASDESESGDTATSPTGDTATSPISDTAASPTSDAVRSVGDPTGVLITRWAADPFAFGSYSYLALGSGPDDRDALRADVGSRLFFAGEATSREYAATVHGALLEGRAAAERIAAVAEEGERVVVIGAGAAGLAAARDLADSGFEVTIVEGRDRIGGRVHTDTSLGVAVDVGASWIHGVDGNPLTELADAIGAARRTTDPDDIVVYDSTGATVPDDDLGTVEAAILGEIEAASERDLADDTETALAELAESVAASVGPELTPLARYLAIANVEHEFGAPLDDMAAGALWHDEGFDGGDVMFPDGYVRVLEPLGVGIDIQTSTTVTYVYHGDDGPELEFADDATMAADRILVTVPLGVLQAEVIEFEPPLPATKIDAIDRLGMGLLDKVVLTFDERFWDDVEVIGFVGLSAGLFVEWYDLTELLGRPALLGFNAADVARELEQRGDDEIVAAALDALRTMFE